MSSSSDRARALLVAILLVLPVVVLQGNSGETASGENWIAWPEEKALDLDYHVRSALRRADPVDDRVRLVLEDDEADRVASSYSSNWDFIGTVLDRIAADHPRAILLDYKFLESFSIAETIADDIGHTRAEASGRHAIDAALDRDLASIEAHLRFRTRFLEAMKEAPVLLPIFCFGDGGATPDDPALLAKSGAVADATAPAWHFGRLAFPDGGFATSATWLAEACEAPDGDGMVRRWMAVAATEGSDHRRILVPGVPVTLARIALGLPPDAVQLVGGELRLGDHRVPLDTHGSALLDLTGGRGAFRARGVPGRPIEYSAALLLENALKPGTFKDKIVLVGEGQRASDDLKATPFAYRSSVPGVELLATATSSVLAERYPLREPGALSRYGFLLSVLLGVLGACAGLFLPMPKGPGLLGWCLGIPIAFIAAAALCFTFAGVWMESAYPAAAWLLAIVGGGFDRYRNQQRERRLLESAFKLYLAPEMVDSVLRDPTSLRLEGQERELTILFSDLRGFTSRTERLPATEMVALLNEHLTAMHDVVVENGGTLDKFIGDCVMAFWGAPSADPDHAVHACRAGERMLAVLAEQNRARAAAGREQLDIGVGVCTGRVVVGNMGSKSRFDYTVIGDAVNLASRLEGLTKDAGYGVLVGERTRELVGNAIEVDELGPMKVKGKAAAVRIFGLSSTRRPASKAATG